MISRISPLIAFLLFFCLGSQSAHTTTNDTVTNTIQPGQSLTTSETIVSANGIFELGFFSPGNSTNYYLGIRYSKKVSEQNVVWVANREYPFPNSSVTLTLNSDGNLVLSDSRMIFMMANASAGNGTCAMLLNTGNLILKNRGFEVFWQSFDNPTDTLLPGMKLGKDFQTGAVCSLTSWKSSEDPAPGLFTLQKEYRTDQLIMMEGSKVYWVSSLFSFDVLNYDAGFVSEYASWPYTTQNISRMVLDVSGQLKLQSWLEDDRRWHSIQSSRCRNYAFCGAFSICNETVHEPNQPCDCLPGFKPLSADPWETGNLSSSTGCARETDLQCTNKNTDVGKDGFLLMSKVDWPENPLQQLHIRNRLACESACLNNCSCIAYAYDQKVDHNVYKFRCFVWNGPLLNLKKLSGDDKYGNEFYLKLAPSELATNGKKCTSTFLLLVERITNCGCCY